MHPMLLQRYRDFEHAHAALARVIEAAWRESAVPACAGINQGGSVRCDLASHQVIARGATASAARARLSPDGTIVGVEVPRLAAQVAALEASVRGLSAIDGRLLPDSIDQSMVADYASEAEEHLRQVKDLYRMARDGARVEGEQWTLVDLDPSGSPQRVVLEFNRTVDRFNDL
jgi:hypothetical protein